MRSRILLTGATALERYPSVAAGQGVEALPELDRWYREELPERISTRRPESITRKELVQLTEWKMARGIWRARNLVLVRENGEASVRDVSAAALAKAPHPTAAIAQLARLRGVGPATASAALSAARPEIYPFFDELVAAQLPSLGPVAWTLRYYAQYADALRAAAQGLGGEWTPTLLERALWAHVGGKAGATTG